MEIKFGMIGPARLRISAGPGRYVPIFLRAGPDSPARPARRFTTLLVTKPSFTLQVYQQFVPEYQFLPPLILSRKWLVAGVGTIVRMFWISDQKIGSGYFC